jgi:uncharacterized protein YbaR (Trm112 family)
MSPKQRRPIAFDVSMLSQLACPACRGDLSVLEEFVCCAQCGRAYPIVDGIPVLIVERSQTGLPRMG